MDYKLTVTIKNLKEEEIPQVLALLKDYERSIEKMAIEKKEEKE